MRMKQINALLELFLSINPNATAKEFASYINITKLSLNTSRGVQNA